PNSTAKSFLQPTTLHEAAMTRVQDVYPDNKVILREVGLRDGLQLVKTFPSTSAKQRWIRDEYAAGVRHFEVGSFLPAKTFPQFADVRDIVATIASLPGAYGIALALNERGVNEALASGVAEVATVVSATEEHSQANANRSRESAIANVKRLCELRDANAHPARGAGVAKCQGALRAARCERAKAGGEFRDLDGAGLFDRGSSRSKGSAAADGKAVRGRCVHGRDCRHGWLRRAEAGRRIDRGCGEDRRQEADLHSPARYERHGHRQRLGRARCRRTRAGRIAGRPRRLPVRAGRDRERRVRGSGVPVRGEGIQNGHAFG